MTKGKESAKWMKYKSYISEYPAPENLCQYRSSCIVRTEFNGEFTQTHYPAGIRHQLVAV
jgi:hypothetical protein